MTDTDRTTLNGDELAELYARASGNRTGGHGAQKWAADVLGVTPRSVRRWLNGETSPTTLEVARLRVRASIEARMRRLRQERERGGGWWPQLRAFFAGFASKVEAQIERSEEERLERLENDPFAFGSWSDFVRFRRSRGLRTRRPPRDPGRSPWAVLHRRGRGS